MGDMRRYADYDFKTDTVNIPLCTCVQNREEIKKLKRRLRKRSFTKNQRSIVEASLNHCLYIAMGNNNWDKKDLDDAKAALKKLRDY